MATKFVTGVVFRQLQTCAKFHSPSSTVTLFSGEGGIHPPVIESQKKPGLNRVNVYQFLERQEKAVSKGALRKSNSAEVEKVPQVRL